MCVNLCVLTLAAFVFLYVYVCVSVRMSEHKLCLEYPFDDRYRHFRFMSHSGKSDSVFARLFVCVCSSFYSLLYDFITANQSLGVICKLHPYTTLRDTNIVIRNQRIATQWFVF